MTRNELKQFIRETIGGDMQTSANVPDEWLVGIFPNRWPISKQREQLEKVITALKKQSPDGSRLYRTQTIATKYNARMEGMIKIISKFVPERRTWPKEGRMKRGIHAIKPVPHERL